MESLRRIVTKWIGRTPPEPRSDLADTAPLRPETLFGRPLQATIRSLTAGSAQSSGLARDNNEDSILVLYGNIFGQQALQGYGLFCLADGAGGHGHGEVASSIAVRAAVGSLLRGDGVQALWEDSSVAALALDDLVLRAMKDANRAVLEKAGGGYTTLTLAAVFGGWAVLGHAGDSRAYRFTPAGHEQLTRDHSMAQRLVEVGQLGEEESRDHPQRATLWNAIGQREEPLLEVTSHEVPRGSYLLLCSDGLWAQVDEESLWELIVDAPNPTVACKAMVRAANAAGGPDNISVVLVAFP